MAIIRALATAVSGRAILEFRNDWDREVTIVEALATLESEAGKMMPLLAAQLTIRLGEPKGVDVTEPLRKMLGSHRTSTFLIRLVLDPEPPTQPQPAIYSVELANGGVGYFGRPRRC
jgi:hypothetical protein